MSEGFNPAELNRRDISRIKGYKELLDFYHGVHWQGRERWGEKRLTFNYARVFVDKVTSYLMSGINFVVEPADDFAEARDGARQAENALYRVYQENNLEQLDYETEIDCAILGDACYKVIWDPRRRQVRVTAPDVQGIYAWYPGDDTSHAWRIASRYTLAADVLSLEQESGQQRGRMTVELSNDDGAYSSLPSPLDIGCRLEVSPGYRTSAGAEVSAGLAFNLEALEHTSSADRATLILHALDGWERVNNWRARHQFRWNKSADEMSVQDLLAFVLARVGLKLEVISQSSLATGYYPDFTIHSGNRGDAIIRRLLSFVPDTIFIEGSKAYLVNPLATDASVYSYGASHSIQSARYREGAWALSRVQVEGYDPVAGEAVIVDSFDWGQLNKTDDRLVRIEDRNIDSVSGAEDRGEAYLRESEIESAGGEIIVPVNCGQQLYDVVDITDNRAGLSAEKKRVLGLVLSYHPARAGYRQRLLLGAV